MRCLHQAEPRVAHERRAGIADERDRFASQETGDKGFSLLVFIVLMQRQKWCSDPEMR